MNLIDGVKALEWERDLLELDGPVLSICRAPDKTPWAWYWCDQDETTNKWLIFETTDKDIYMFNPRKDGALKLLQKSPNGNCYYADLDGKGEILKVQELNIADIPYEYMPQI